MLPRKRSLRRRRKSPKFQKKRRHLRRKLVLLRKLKISGLRRPSRRRRSQRGVDVETIRRIARKQRLKLRPLQKLSLLSQRRRPRKLLRLRKLLHQRLL